jgi:hypothetical protein
MDNLGIVVDDYNQDMDEDYSDTSSTNYEKKIDFSTFVQDIYINCVD